MRKAFLLIGVLALALGITYLVLHKNSSGTDKQEVKDAPLSVGNKSSAFNRSFNEVLNRYYELAGIFGTGDTSKITAAAQKLNKAVDSIRFNEFKADSSVSLTALSVAQSIQGEVMGLIGEKTMDQKKRELNLITEDLYSLIRVVRFDGAVVYHLRSTGVFADSSEVYWLSATPKIVNPYNGQAANGEISDSLRFSAPANE